MAEEQNKQREERLDTNINNLWLTSLFAKIEETEKLLLECENGCKNIVDFFRLTPQETPSFQFQNLKMLINLFLITLVDSKFNLTDEFFKKAKTKLNKMKFATINQREKIIQTKEDHLRHGISHKIQPLFYLMMKEVGELREEMVTQLAPILYGQEKSKSLDKSKKEFKNKKWQNLKM